MGSSILIVHGEKQLRSSTRNILEKAGHDVREARELGQANGFRPDLLLISWAALSPVSRRAAYAGVAEISVYVAAASRRIGVGTRLIEAAIRKLLKGS